MATNRTPIKHKERWDYFDWCDDSYGWDGVPAKHPRPWPIEIWERHRDEIMRYEAVGGRRPPEWWLYQKGREPAGTAVMYEEHKNELHPAELKHLLENWRHFFELATKPDPFFSNGSDVPPYKGKDAYQAWIAFADIPQSLVVQWSAEL